MRKSIFCFSLILLICIAPMFAGEDSPDFKNRFIRSWSITPFSSFNASPIGECPVNVDSKGYISPTFTINGIWYHHHFRYNLHEFNSENAIGLNVAPSVGLVACLNTNVDGVGVGHFTFPLYVSYETGAGSTYASEKDLGYSFGLGLEYHLLPFFFAGSINESRAEYANRSFLVPVLTFSSRKWAENSAHLISRNFKFGILPYSYMNYDEMRKVNSVVFTFNFSFGTFLRY
ncbi:MAG: hypothetical protein ACKOXB_04650 [Flavobacteriales bacterium]